MIGASSARGARRFAVRVSLLYAAIFVVAGTQLPYLPIWLDWAGLSAQEIGVITATPLLIRVVVTPVIAFVADRHGDHRRFLIGLSWAGLAALVALSQSTGFWPILGWVVLFALAWTTVMPLTETVAMAGVKASGLDYGRMRLWGSLTFIAASFCGGWIVERFGPPSAIWLVVFGGVLVTAAVHTLQPISANTGTSRLALSDAAGLLRSRTFQLFLLAVGAVQAAHAVFYTFGTLHWRAVGLSTAWSGTLWAIGVIAEIVLFAWSKAVLRHIAAIGLITLGAAAAVARWIAMGFDPPLVLLIPLQALHGLTYGATHLGAMHLMLRLVPDGQSGTAQALYASVTGGIAMGAAMLLAGPLYAGYRGHAYWAMALIALAGLAASLVLPRLEGSQPHSRGAGG
jgi:PPP family 3-phenylpropionic acid transporter